VSPAEEDLDGGIANAGRVVRVGKHVLRPPTAHTRSVHAYLRAVRDAGFDGVPEPVGIDDDGRERLEFVEGDVPLGPYPDWSQSEPHSRPSPACCADCTTPREGSTRVARPGTTAWSTRPAGRWWNANRELFAAALR
jgi:hypothetical protein